MPANSRIRLKFSLQVIISKIDYIINQIPKCMLMIVYHSKSNNSWDINEFTAQTNVWITTVLMGIKYFTFYMSNRYDNQPSEDPL